MSNIELDFSKAKVQVPFAAILSIGTEPMIDVLTEVVKNETYIPTAITKESDAFAVKTHLDELASEECGVRIIFVVRDGKEESAAVAERIISGLEKTKIIDVPVAESVAKLQSAMTMLRVDSVSFCILHH